MQMNKIRLDGHYVYYQGASKSYERAKKYTTYEHYRGPWKVKVLEKNVKRYSKSTHEYRNDGVEVLFVDSPSGDDHVEVIPANRIKEGWWEAPQYMKDAAEKESEARNKSRVLQAKRDKIEEDFVTHLDDVTDLLDANGFVENEDYRIQNGPLTKGVMLYGSGMRKLVDVLHV